jgi:hypothetical protein
VNALTRTIVIGYLVLWTTAVAWLSTLIFRLLYPQLYSSVIRVERDVLDLIPHLTPLIASLFALYLGEKILRGRRFFSKGMIVGYFVGAPVLIFLVLLVIISMLTLIFAPITFVLGIYYGAAPLLLGTILHCFGMAPLYFLPVRPAGAERATGRRSEMNPL